MNSPIPYFGGKSRMAAAIIERIPDHKRELDRPTLTDIQRAAAYYYVQRHAFAGRPRIPSLATSPSRPVRCRRQRPA